MTKSRSNDTARSRKGVAGVKAAAYGRNVSKHWALCTSSTEQTDDNNGKMRSKKLPAFKDNYHYYNLTGTGLRKETDSATSVEN